MENEKIEITLEKIELVKDRTGVSYKEAKEALTAANGNVVDAIIIIEDGIDFEEEKTDKAGKELLDKIKELVHKGNISKVKITKDGEVIVNMPVNVGILGTIIFPWAIVAGTIAAFGSKCAIELVGVEGNVINVSEKATDAFETAVSKGGVVVDEVKVKGADFVNAAKDKTEDLVQVAKEKTAGVAEFAKEKTAEVAEFAKEKTAEIKWRADDTEVQESDDFDLSDLDLSSMGNAEEEKNQ